MQSRTQPRNPSQEVNSLHVATVQNVMLQTETTVQQRTPLVMHARRLDTGSKSARRSNKVGV